MQGVYDIVCGWVYNSCLISFCHLFIKLQVTTHLILQSYVTLETINTNVSCYFSLKLNTAYCLYFAWLSVFTWSSLSFKTFFLYLSSSFYILLVVLVDLYDLGVNYLYVQQLVFTFIVIPHSRELTQFVF